MPPRQQTLLIAVDGGGGSGKSTFARVLQKQLPDLSIVHMDDFYLPSALRPPAEAVSHTSEDAASEASFARETPFARELSFAQDFDWQRLLKQVLEPLSRDEPGYYQRYDWLRDQLTDFHTLPVGGIVVVEGVYAMMSALRPLYDYTVWVNCPAEIRLARGLDRDGEAARDLWVNRWMPAEARYMERERPADHANLVIDGSGVVQHNPETEFVVERG